MEVVIGNLRFAMYDLRGGGGMRRWDGRDFFFNAEARRRGEVSGNGVTGLKTHWVTMLVMVVSSKLSWRANWSMRGIVCARIAVEGGIGAAKVVDGFGAAPSKSYWGGNSERFFVFDGVEIFLRMRVKRSWAFFQEGWSPMSWRSSLRGGLVADVGGEGLEKEFDMVEAVHGGGEDFGMGE